MAVTLGSPPLADFSRPIQLLIDCHRRIEHFLSVMCMLTERSSGNDLDEEFRRACSTLDRLLDDLSVAYTAHIRLEDENVFAMGTRVLTQREQCEIGAEMKQRRNPDPGQDAGVFPRKPGKLSSDVDEEKL